MCHLKQTPHHALTLSPAARLKLAWAVRPSHALTLMSAALKLTLAQTAKHAWPLEAHRLSISSMKTVVGAIACAISKRHRTMRSIFPLQQSFCIQQQYCLCIMGKISSCSDHKAKTWNLNFEANRLSILAMQIVVRLIAPAIKLK